MTPPEAPSAEQTTFATSQLAGFVDFFEKTVDSVYAYILHGTRVPDAAAELLRDWQTVERVLGLPPLLSATPSPEVEQLARERQDARQKKDWKRSDELREAIKAQGWLVQDSTGGCKLTRL